MLDAHQKLELSGQKSWLSSINNSTRSWLTDDRKIRQVECPFQQNGNYYLVISKKQLDCFEAKRGETPHRSVKSALAKVARRLTEPVSCVETFSLSSSRYCGVVWSGCWMQMKHCCHMTLNVIGVSPYNRVSYFIMVASLETISCWHWNCREVRIWRQHEDFILSWVETC